MAKISVIGCGWGTALAMVAHDNGHDVVLWSPFKAEVDEINEKREQTKLLPGVKIPDEIFVTDDLQKLDNSDLIIVAPPCRFVREVAEKIKTLSNIGIIAVVSKGLEDGTLLRMSEVVEEVIPSARVVALSGPSHVEEVARKIPTSIVSSSKDAKAAEIAANLMMNGNLRIYINNDIVGVELGGALKNVIALAAGILDGMGLGDNTKAALMTRGLSEMSRLGVTMGAERETFSGLTGIGDLVVTCTSMHSRNRRFGILVGEGVPVDKALEEIGTVEGYYTAKMAYELSVRQNVTMPIVSECHNILYKGKSVDEAIKSLMGRPIRSEHDFLYD